MKYTNPAKPGFRDFLTKGSRGNRTGSIGTFSEVKGPMGSRAKTQRFGAKNGVTFTDQKRVVEYDVGPQNPNSIRGKLIQGISGLYDFDEEDG